MHPDSETLAAWIECKLAGDAASVVRDHLKTCTECRIVAGAAAPRSSRGWWIAAAAAWIVAIGAGWLIPVNRPATTPPRTYVHLDFAGHSTLYAVTDGNIVKLVRNGRDVTVLRAVSSGDVMLVAGVRLQDPILVGPDSRIRVRFGSNATEFNACLMPLNQDAVILRLDSPGKSADAKTGIARVDVRKARPVDTIFIVTPKTPAGAYLELESIEID